MEEIAVDDREILAMIHGVDQLLAHAHQGSGAVRREVEPAKQLEPPRLRGTMQPHRRGIGRDRTARLAAAALSRVRSGPNWLANASKKAMRGPVVRRRNARESRAPARPPRPPRDRSADPRKVGPAWPSVARPTSRRSRVRSISARPRSAMDWSISPKKEVFTGTQASLCAGRLNSALMTNSQTQWNSRTVPRSHRACTRGAGRRNRPLWTRAGRTRHRSAAFPAIAQPLIDTEETLMPGPLTGLRVLELARILAGPWAGQILADLGADVIKVERKGTGDDTRGWGPPFVEASEGGHLGSAYFHATNRGKRSIEVDFDSEEGRRIVRKLAARADVLIENFKVGGLAKFGLDYASLSKENPRLIYCSVTGFGQTGPYAARAGYDLMAQGIGGIMELTGDPDGEPQRTGVPVADIFTGVYSAVGILAALQRARAHRARMSGRHRAGRQPGRRPRQSGPQLSGVRPGAEAHRQRPSQHRALSGVPGRRRPHHHRHRQRQPVRQALCRVGRAEAAGGSPLPGELRSTEASGGAGRAPDRADQGLVARRSPRQARSPCRFRPGRSIRSIRCSPIRRLCIAACGSICPVQRRRRAAFPACAPRSSSAAGRRLRSDPRRASASTRPISCARSAKPEQAHLQPRRHARVAAWPRIGYTSSKARGLPPPMQLPCGKRFVRKSAASRCISARGA